MLTGLKCQNSQTIFLINQKTKFDRIMLKYNKIYFEIF